MTRRVDSLLPEVRQGLKEMEKSLEHRTRLALCVLLSRSDSMSFSRLKELVEESDGSLGAHLAKLEEEGFLAVRKEFRERKPVTWYALTKRGKEALGSHLEALSRLIRQASGRRA